MQRIPLFILLLLFMSHLTCQAETTKLRSGVFDPPRAAPDFSLPGSHGKTFTLSENKDKLLVLGFGFSHCPDVCPVTLAKLAQVQKNLGDLASHVQVVYVTVDPERDTVERLREYMTHFNPNFIGLTGSDKQLTRVREAYGILAAKIMHGDGSYSVQHSTYLYLIDRHGLLRALVPFGKTTEDITHDIKVLLQEAPRQTALPQTRS